MYVLSLPDFVKHDSKEIMWLNRLPSASGKLCAVVCSIILGTYWFTLLCCIREKGKRVSAGGFGNVLKNTFMSALRSFMKGAVSVRHDCVQHRERPIIDV